MDAILAFSFNHDCKTNENKYKTKDRPKLNLNWIILLDICMPPPGEVCNFFVRSPPPHIHHLIVV